MTLISTLSQKKGLSKETGDNSLYLHRLQEHSSLPFEMKISLVTKVLPVSQEPVFRRSFRELLSGEAHTFSPTISSLSRARFLVPDVAYHSKSGNANALLGSLPL